MSCLDLGYRGESNLLRPPSEALRCSEVVVVTTRQTFAHEQQQQQHQQQTTTPPQSITSVTLRCTISKQNDSLTTFNQQSIPEFLEFSCRRPSYGVLTNEEQETCRRQQFDLNFSKEEEEEDAKGYELSLTDTVADSDRLIPHVNKNDPFGSEDDTEDDGVDDACFFLLSAKSYPYALAGKTGFQIWPGSRILVDALTFPHLDGGENMDHPRLRQWQGQIGKQTHGSCQVLELGAGVGVVGTSLAVAGAEVLMTDLPTVVKKSLIPNLQRNAKAFASTKHHSGELGVSNNNKPLQVEEPPAWLRKEENKSGVTRNKNDGTIFRIGKGWATAMPLDWMKPIQQQLKGQQYQHLHLIIASDCVWLVSMLGCLFDTVESLFEASTMLENDLQSSTYPSPTLLLSFQRRDSDMFTTVDRVFQEVRVRGWSIQCLAWYPVSTSDDDGEDNNNGPRGDKESTQQDEVFLFEISKR